MKRLLKWIGIVLASLIVMPLLTLLVLSHRGGAGKLHASTELAASREQVWAWLDESDHLKQWVSWLVEVREPATKHGAGSERTLVMRDENDGGMLMELNGRIKAYEPPSRLTIGLGSPVYQFDGDQTYTLTDLGNGRTRLDIDSTFHYAQWFANLMEPIVTPIARKKLVGDLARLKTLVETKADMR